MNEHLDPQAQELALDEPPPTIPHELPILPIRNTVAFPGTIMPLTVARQKSQRLIDVVVQADKLMGVLAQRSAKVEDPVIEDLYRVGTVCRVVKLLTHEGPAQTVIIQGICRFGVESLIQSQPFWKAKINTHRDESEHTLELEALMNNVRTAAQEVIERSPHVPEEASMMLNAIDEPGPLADFLAANLSLGLVHKQEFLETFDLKSRLIKVHTALESQLQVLKLSQELQSQVQDQIDKTQRHYYLHEQLKAIRKELGEEEVLSAELKELESKVRDAHMPEQADAEARRELQRMTNMPQTSPEYALSLDYVSWLCELPWTTRTQDRLDVREAAEILDEDHYGLKKIKKRILEFLAVRKLKPDGKGPILCFAGPPGVGKTSLGRSIARALGRKFIRMSLGGIRDEAALRGHRRTYVGALPGRIIQEIRKAGANNPVFMLDEVDKIGNDFRGDPAYALLEILDPQQNDTFTDHYLNVPFDLSNVLFIATANYMDAVPPPLRDRMEVLWLDSYTHGEKLAIAKQYLLPRQIEENGLTTSLIAIGAPALREVIAGYTREAGVRGLERQIGAICRAVTAQVAAGKKTKTRVKKQDVQSYLGPKQFEPEAALRTATPGVVTGLAFTPAGGEILFVEAITMPGDGNLILTGQVGSVMKESAHAGFSLLRSRAREWGITEKLLSSIDLHIHIPAGAIPKDGPSAGVAMLLAMVSTVTDRVARPDVAMTGEITLRGLILPVGGVKEKVLAAYRAGIKTVMLPQRNRKDFVDVPQEVQSRMRFEWITDIGQAMDLALLPTRKSRSKRRPKS